MSDVQTDAENEGISFRSVAIDIADDLHDDDLKALIFLSRDFLPAAKLERITSGVQLFNLWEKAKKFGSNNPWFLAECLEKIQRLDLLDALQVDETELEQRLSSGKSQIPDYRKMLLEIAEDLDSDELQKMLYLSGDIKKKQRDKIHSPMDFFVYLEQIKQASPDNVTKLKDLLSQLDRNDLRELITTYEDSKGIAPEQPQASASSAASSKVESMDTSESEVPAETRGAELPYQSIHHHTSRLVNHAQPVEREPPRRVAYELPNSSTTSVQGLPELPGAQPLPQPPKYHEHPGSSSVSTNEGVIPDAILSEIAEYIGQQVGEQNWITFGYQLKLKPVMLEKLTQKFPDPTERTRHLLKLWVQGVETSFDDAMAVLINSLHEAMVHELADRLANVYTLNTRTQGGGEGEFSLTRRPGPMTSEDVTNVASTNEAQVVFLQQNEPAVVPVPQVDVAVPVAVPSASRGDENIVPHYKMTARPRGICIIINNERFHKDPADVRARDMPHREGTRVDADNLWQTFLQLDFQIQRFDDLKAHEMVRALVSCSLNTDHTAFDCFVCCILSHGTQGHIYGADGNLVSITDLTSPFRSVSCRSLAGKPKLFFVQACQGREKQPGQELERDGAAPEEDGVPREVIPNEADFLIGYATVPGFVSYRSRSHGSWYVTKLCEMLNKYGKRIDLLSVLLMVNNEVGRANAMMDGGRYKQSPAPLYTLRKKLLFT